MPKKRLLLARWVAASATAVVLLTTAGSALAQELVWVHRFGGEFFDLGFAVAGDETAAYVAGAALGAIPGETALGAQDAFVRKVDPSGTPLWTDQFGTAESEGIQGIALDAGAVYVAGATGGTLPDQQSSGLSDAFVRRYSSDGEVVWTRQFGTSSFDEIRDVDAMDGAVYLVGLTSGVLGPGGGGGATDIFVRKLDGNGAMLWTKQLGGTGPDTGEGIAVHDGSVYVVGCTGWFCGSFNGADAYLARLNADDGSVIWERTFGVPSQQDEALDVAADSTGIYVSGWTEGVLPEQTSAGFLDGYVRKYNDLGDVSWTRQLGSASDDRVHGIAARSGGVYVVGVTGGALPGQVSNGFDDVFVSAFDGRSGADLWSLQFGSRDFETGRAVTALADRLYIAGDGVVFGSVVFPTTLPDAFVARIGIGIDVMPPVLTLPPEVVADATGPTGATVEFVASATDDVDGEVPVTCTPPSGSTFPIGTTVVSCIASDAAGNTASGEFAVHVKGAPEQLSDLIALVESYELTRLGTSLQDKLSAAQELLTAGKPSEAKEALAAFIHQVNTQRGKALTIEQADQLELAARRIIDVIDT
jgi:hypothetical protein